MIRARIFPPLTALCLAFAAVHPVGAVPLSALLSAASDSGSRARSDAYREGQRALEEERWSDAVRAFEGLTRGDGPEADAALYWKAYADWKLQHKKDALEGLRRLLSDHPGSAWSDDARVLEQEIRGGKTANTRVEDDADEQLKLQALESLLEIEPEKSVPVLDRLLSGSSSLQVKERALFVLSQYDSARAREVLLRVARTGAPADLRREAVKTLGISGEPDDIAALRTIVREPNAPTEVREAVIEAFLIADRAEELAMIARSDRDPQLRGKAIEALAAIGALSSLRPLWSSEKDPKLQRKLLEAFGIAEDFETLAKIARESPQPELRRQAIEGLGVMGGPEAGDVLRELYGKLTDPQDKRKVLEALMISDDADALIELFRQEKDPATKRVILQQLSVMDDPDVTKVILEVLGEKQ